MSLEDIIKKLQAGSTKSQSVLSPADFAKQTTKNVGFDIVRSARDVQQPQPKPEYNVLEEIKGTIGRAPYQAAAQISDMAGWLTGIKGFARTSEGLQQEARREFPTNAPSITTSDDFNRATWTDLAKYGLAESGQVLSSLVSMSVPGAAAKKMLLPLIGKAASASPKLAKFVEYLGGAEKAAEYASGFTAGTALEAGSISSDAFRETGEMPGIAKGLPWAMAAGVLESLTPIRLAARFAAKVPAEIAEEALKKSGKGLISHIINYAKDMGVEGGTEFLQTLIEEAGVKNIAGTPAAEAIVSTIADPEARARAKAAGISGSFGGGVVGGPGFVSDVVSRNEIPAEPKAKIDPEDNVAAIKQRLSGSTPKPTIQQDVSQSSSATDDTGEFSDKPAPATETVDIIKKELGKISGAEKPGQVQPADIGDNTPAQESQSKKKIKQLSSLLDGAGIVGPAIDNTSMALFNKPLVELSVPEIDQFINAISEQLAQGNVVSPQAPELQPTGIPQPQMTQPQMQPIAPAAPQLTGLEGALQRAQETVRQRQAEAPRMQQPARIEMPQTQDVTRQITPEDIQPFAEARIEPEVTPVPEAKAEPEVKAEPEAVSDKNIGREWDSPFGKQKIVSIIPGNEEAGISPLYEVETIETGEKRRYRAESIDEVIRGDEYRLTEEYKKEQELEKEIAREKERKKAADRETAERAAIPVNEFVSGMSPMRAGKVRKSLAKEIRSGGKVMTKQELVESRINDGYLPVEKNGKMILQKGKIYVTIPEKIAFEYAKWYAENRTAVEVSQEEAIAKIPSETKAPETKKGYGESNTVVTKDRYEELKKRFKSKAKNITSGVDPEMLAIATEMAAYHLEAGVRKFADFTKAIISDVGEEFRPYLASSYLGAKYFPGSEKYRADMDSEAEVNRQIEQAEKSAEPETEPEPSRPEVGKPGEINAAALSDALIPTVESFLTIDKPMTNPQLEKVMRDLGVDTKDPNYNHKITQEALEGAIVKVIREKNLYGDYDALIKLYENQPRLEKKTADSVARQAYSTPVPLVAMLTDSIGVIRNSDVVYEPTAGNGLLLSGIERGSGNNFYLNELDQTRNDILKSIFPDASITNSDATKYDPPVNADIILANPPFGSAPDYKITTEGEKRVEITLKKIDHIIAYKALQNMKDNGKAVLIMGAQKDGKISGSNAQFLRYLYNQFNITGHFEVSGDLYKRQGAGWPLMIVTIEGKKSFPKDFIGSPKQVRRAENWNEIKQITSEIKPGTYINRKSEAAGPRPDELGRGEAETKATPEGGRKTGIETQARPGRTSGPNTAITGRAEQQQPVGDRRRDTGPTRDTRRDIEQPSKQPAGKDQRGTADRPGGLSVDDSGVVETELQAKYSNKSEASSINSLIPVNLKNPTEKALSDVLDSVEEKTLDDYVAHQLGLKDKSEMVTQDGKSWFSGEQVDALALIFKNLNNKSGTVIADQTGVGKGRTAAGAIKWAVENGKIPVFMTERDALFSDIYRDLKNTSAENLRPFILNKKGKMISNEKEIYSHNPGVYKQVIKRMQKGDYSDFIGKNRKFDYIVGTYLNTTYKNSRTGERPRLNALMNAPDKSLVLIMDESHNAASGVSDISLGFNELLSPNKSDGVLFLSATWAKRPDNLNLYHRAFGREGLSSDEISRATEKGGVAIQEMLTANMARNGSYLRREQSYAGVNFDRLVTEDVARSAKEVKVSDNVMDNIRGIISIDQASSLEQAEIDIEDLLPERFQGGTLKGGYVAASLSTPTSPFSQVHNYISNFLTSLKADQAANYAIEQIKKGIKPVIVVQNTMGSQLDILLQSGKAKMGEKFTGTFADYLENVMTKTRMVTVENPFDSKEQITITIPLDRFSDEFQQRYNEIIDQIKKSDFGDMPFSYIDLIKYKIQKAGYSIGEITKRDKYIDYSDGTIKNRDKKETSTSGVQEIISGFNSGLLDAMILNVAGATGMSLHSSVEFKDQRMREMIILQPFGDINKFMQALGRIHRVGEIVNEKDVTSVIEGLPATYGYPAYKYLQSSLDMEIRPGIQLENKMKSLNANTSSNAKGHHKVADVDVMNKYGLDVMIDWLNANPEVAEELGYGDNKEPTKPEQVTGRLAILPNKVQAEFWADVIREYKELIDALDAAGKNDLTITTYKDANAKTIQKNLIFGREGDVSLPAIYAEKVEMKITGKPTSIEQAKNRMESGISDEQIKEAESVFEEFIKEKEAERDARIAKGLKSGIKIDAIMASKDAIQNKLKELQPGRLVTSSDGFAGIINKVEFYRMSGNTFAPGNIKITMSAPNAGGSLIISLSGFNKQNMFLASGNIDNMPSTFRSNYQRQYEENKTQIATKYMLTGDMIRAAGMANNINAIQFQREDGGMDFGWLFEGTPRAAAPTMPLTDGDIQEYPLPYVVSSDDNIKIGLLEKDLYTGKKEFANKTNATEIYVAKSARYSTAVTTDEQLRSMLSQGPQDPVFEVGKITGNKQWFKTKKLSLSESERKKVLARMKQLAQNSGTSLVEGDIPGRKKDTSRLKNEPVTRIPSSKSGRAGLLEIFSEWAVREASELLESAFRFVQRGGGSFLNWLKTVPGKFRNLASKAWKDARKLYAEINNITGLSRRGGIVSLREFEKALQESIKMIPEKKITPAVTEEIAFVAAETGYELGAQMATQRADKTAAYRKRQADKRVAGVKEKLAALKEKKSLEQKDRKYLVNLASKIPVKDRGALIRSIATATTPNAVNKAISRIEKLYEKTVRRSAMKRFKAAVSAAKKLRPEFQEIANEIKSNPYDQWLAYETLDGVVRYLEDDEAVFVPGEALTAFESLRTNKPKQMSVDTINMISEVLETIKFMSDQENKRIFAQNTETLKGSVDDIAAHVLSQKKIEEGEGSAEFARWFFNLGSMQYEAVTEAMGETGRKLFYEDIRDGERRAKEIWFEGRDKLHKVMNENGVDPESVQTQKWLEEEVAVSFGDKDIKMTRGEMLNLVANFRDSSTRKEIASSGVRIGEEIYRPDDNDLVQLDNSLGKKEEAIISSMRSFINTELKANVNDTWVNLAGYEKALAEDYWPRTRDIKKTGMNQGYRQWAKTALEELGIFKQRERSKAPVVIKDVMQVYQNHLKKASTFSGLAVPIRNLELAMGKGGLGELLEKQYGKKFVKRLEEQIQAVADLGAPGAGELNSWAAKIIKNISIGFLGFNPRSALKQFGGLFTAATEISGDLLASSVGHAFNKNTEKEMYKYSAILRDRYDSTGAKLVTPTFDTGRKIAGLTKREIRENKAMWLLETFDKAVSQIIWEASKKEIRSNNPDLSGEEFFMEVARRAEQVVSRTQNVTSIVDMSGIAIESRKNTAFKALTMFQSQGNSIYNIMRRNVRDVRTGKISPAKFLGNIVLASVGNAAWSSVVGSLISAPMIAALLRGGGDEEDRKKLKAAFSMSEIAWDIVRDNINSIYGGSLVSPFMNSARRIINKEPTFNSSGKIENVVESVLNKTLQGGEHVLKAAISKGEKFKSGPNKGKYKTEIELKRGAVKIIRGIMPLIGEPLFPVSEALKLL